MPVVVPIRAQLTVAFFPIFTASFVSFFSHLKLIENLLIRDGHCKASYPKTQLQSL